MTSTRLTPEEIEALQQHKVDTLAAATRALAEIKADRVAKQEATDAST